MPTFWKGKNLIHFVAFKKHIGLYPGDEATAAFAEQLADFEVSKGTIRFPHDLDLPEALIAVIAITSFPQNVNALLPMRPRLKEQFPEANSHP